MLAALPEEDGYRPNICNHAATSGVLEIGGEQRLQRHADESGIRPGFTFGVGLLGLFLVEQGQAGAGFISSGFFDLDLATPRCFRSVAVSSHE